MISFNVPPFTGNEITYIKEAVDAHKICGDGQFTKKCNAWIEEKMGTSKALLTTSCTHATEMAALLLDIKEGDEVIMPAYTFVSTADAFVLRGATAVFVDIDPRTMNMDADLIEDAITDRTRAIVPVHYAGVACDMDKIMNIAQKESASMELIKAVVKMRSTKEQQEIEELERASVIGYKMHTTAMRLTRPGLTEKYIGGQVDGIAHSYGAMVSFPTIFSQHGEIMHGNPSMAKLESGRLVLCDAGAETINNYCSDHTRTYPVNGKFSQRQLEIYSIVEAAHDHALEVARPGVKYADVHFSVCRLIFDRLKELGLAKGDTEEAVRQGAHAMFLPHGLGHMMGMDVHDMENLDQVNVGFDEETRPNLEQFGTNCLRMGRRLQEGFVVTDEPGIYFIPALIDEWRAKGHCKDFLCFDKLETYKDFGGIRIEDDLLITADGARFLGNERIPYHPKDVEAYMAENKQ